MIPTKRYQDPCDYCGKEECGCYDVEVCPECGEAPCECEAEEYCEEDFDDLEIP